MRVLLSLQRTQTGAEVRRPREQDVELAFDGSGDAHAFRPGTTALVAQLRRARVAEIALGGLRIEGLEPHGTRLVWQVWWCRPTGDSR